MKNNFVAFADSKMARTFKRLSKQVKSLKFFEGVYLFDESNLSIDFKEKFKDKLIAGSRGYGYWSWKPEAILMAFNKIEEGDRLLYIDSGCHLNIDGKKRLIEYFNILDKEEKGIIAFQTKQPHEENSTLIYDGRLLFDHHNYQYIKGDLLDYFGVRNDDNYVKKQMIEATVILIKKCLPAHKIIKEWQDIIWKRFDLLDDTPSVSPNLSGFIEHRHDQAIWSLLCLKYKIKTISSYEYFYPINNGKRIELDLEALKKYPIHAMRDKNWGFIKNTISNIKRTAHYISIFDFGTILSRLKYKIINLLK
jgi:hypothetical protein